MFSSEGPPHIVASYDKLGYWGPIITQDPTDHSVQGTSSKCYDSGVGPLAVFSKE
jgi:hypothetical protein